MTERTASQAERWAVVACCTVASMIAIVWSWQHDAMLNYGDAVAHLHIARRVFDSRTPRFSQLGSVWLPLPHILLIPFVQNFEWWATGLAGVIPSALAYITACAGMYRLVRHFASRRSSALALAFFALNPNLLYLQTTAMTEPLFLCETIWIVVWMVEWRAAVDKEAARVAVGPRVGISVRSGPIAASIEKSLRAVASAPAGKRGAWLAGAFQPQKRKGMFAARSSRLLACVASTLVAAVLTRYDGWIIALIAWVGVGVVLWSYRRLSNGAFWLLTIVVIAAPVFWFIYNSVAFGDWLYFARGPFSAKAIELRTAPMGTGPLHPGWHDPWVALLFFLKAAELDSIAAAAKGNAIANLCLAFAALGTVACWIAEKSAAQCRAFAWILLLWLPVPFYAWSVAYGSVPIFFPTWWPYTLYNTRYGLELLPAFAVGFGFAAETLAHGLRRIVSSRRTGQELSGQEFDQLFPAPAWAGIVFAACFALVTVNLVEELQTEPVVYAESTKNLDARLQYDESVPPVLDDLLAFLPHAPIVMNTSMYPEIVAFAGIPLRETINESDLEIFRAALADPASSAAIVVTFEGDDVDRAVKAHPENLAIAARFTAQGQPDATIYFSTKWMDRSPILKNPIEKTPDESIPKEPSTPAAL